MAISPVRTMPAHIIARKAHAKNRFSACFLPRKLVGYKYLVLYYVRAVDATFGEPIRKPVGYLKQKTLAACIAVVRSFPTADHTTRGPGHPLFDNGLSKYSITTALQWGAIFCWPHVSPGSAAVTWAAVTRYHRAER